MAPGLTRGGHIYFLSADLLGEVGIPPADQRIRTLLTITHRTRDKKGSNPPASGALVVPGGTTVASWGLLTHGEAPLHLAATSLPPHLVPARRDCQISFRLRPSACLFPSPTLLLFFWFESFGVIANHLFMVSFCGPGATFQ